MNEFKLTITDYANNNGYGIGRHDGKVYFVPGTVIGDEIMAREESWKGSYGLASIVDMLAESKDRTTPPCEYFSECGGCDLQNMDYEAQLIWKRNRIIETLKRIGKQPNPPVKETEGMKNPYHYRNKATFNINTDGRICNIKRGSSDLIPIKSCMLQPDSINKICDISFDCVDKKNEFKRKNSNNEYDRKCNDTVDNKLSSVIVKTSSSTGESLVNLIMNADNFPKSADVNKHADVPENAKMSVWEDLFRKLDFADTITLNKVINKGSNEGRRKDSNEVRSKGWNNSRSKGSNEGRNKDRNNGRSKGRRNSNPTIQREICKGSGQITEKILEKEFIITDDSFYQTNPTQAQKMIEIIGSLVGFHGSETLYDLYCGVGFLGLSFADNVKTVIGCDTNKDSIRNALKNAELNGIENAEYLRGKAEDVFPEYASNAGEGDIVYLDPPRSGCEKSLLKMLGESVINRIVYVSCDPATFARDVRILGEYGYELRSVTPLDMFPQTVHIESVSLLSRLDNR